MPKNAPSTGKIPPKTLPKTHQEAPETAQRTIQVPLEGLKKLQASPLEPPNPDPRKGSAEWRKPLNPAAAAGRYDRRQPAVSDYGPKGKA